MGLHCCFSIEPIDSAVVDVRFENLLESIRQENMWPSVIDNVRPFICFKASEPPDIIYHNSYIMIGDFSLFWVSYFHWTMRLIDVTFASKFLARTGSRNK